jgi:hypothetical protein
MQTSAKDITVLDPSETVCKIAGFLRLGELHMSDVKSMVATVYARVLQNRADIRGLRVIDHGNATGCQFGRDFVTAANFNYHSRELYKLKGAFCPYTGFAQMQHCLAGRNTPLLEQFAKLWNVPVYGGLWYTNGLGLNMFGYEFEGALTGMVKAIPNPLKGFQQWVRVDPSGKVTSNVSVP